MPVDRSHRYAMLMCALPYHGPLFGARQTPLSRLRLQQRQRLLEPEDAATLHCVAELLEWTRQEMEMEDEVMAARARTGVPAIANPFVRELVEWRLELRTLVAALRRRHGGEPAPTAPIRWGYGRWLGQIARNWSEPAFHLERAFPWLPEASRLLAAGDTLALERLLLGVAWARLEQLAEGHRFDFEAVLLYALRWDLVARWTAYDGEQARQRFDELVAAGLAPLNLDELVA